MTELEAIEYVQACGEADGPESYEEAAELFAAIFGRAPDDADGDALSLWSHVCAAVPRADTSVANRFAQLTVEIADEGVADAERREEHERDERYLARGR